MHEPPRQFLLIGFRPQRGLATESLRSISAVKNDGFAESTVRIVSGNARTLKFEDSSFEDR